jgi:uncharacterized membrane protein YhaH (DUF805 family)
MKSNITSSTGKVKRRNFFYYLGASLVGIFSISKLPFNIIQNKINKEIAGSIKISENPQAVKREKTHRGNNG